MSDQVEVDNLATFDDISKLVKGKWRKARVAIGGECLGSVKRVKRMAFHENDDGRLIVVLYEETVRAK